MFPKFVQSSEKIKLASGSIEREERQPKKVTHRTACHFPRDLRKPPCGKKIKNRSLIFRYRHVLNELNGDVRKYENSFI